MSDRHERPMRPDDILIEVAREVATRAIGEAAREEIDLPHIVVCRDPETGLSTYSGPFRDGLAALVAAEEESARDLASANGCPMSFSVAALFPA